jgi:aspartyl-tRNA(Asn)/glutamyl-tRNA(Gln) amidotransferase subunit A
MISGTTYVAAQRVRRVICEEFSQAFENLDVIVTPTTPLAAPKIEECKTGYVEVDGRKIPYQNPTGSFGTVFTIPFNLTGLPAMSICCGYSSSGLPIGIQIVAPAFQEAIMLQVAHAYEQVAGWYRTRPVIKQD